MADKLKELFLYIKEKRETLDQIIKDIGLEKKDLLKEKKELVQCKYNCNHYIPRETMSQHLTLCPYMGLGMTRQETEHFLNDFSTNSSKTPGHSINIDTPTSLAIHEYINIKRREEEGGATGHMTQGSLPSLESNSVNNDVLQSGDPILLIRYIKSWSVIPHIFCQLVPSSIHPVSLKSWLFQNIPEYHVFKHEVGGALHIVDTILHQFNLTPTVTPDLLINRLHPFLFTASRGLVLSMWKFLSLFKIQQEHNISDATVNELLPLSNHVPTNDTTSLVSQIMSLASRQSITTSQLPLPMEYVQNSVEERKVLYDYCVERGKQELGERRDCYLSDQSLFRDDTRLLSAKEKREEDEKTHLEQLKEKRDIRRRRQSYRAKNVHITQKSIKQMFREIIAARTEELKMALGAKWEEDNESYDSNKEQFDDSVKREISPNDRTLTTCNKDSKKFNRSESKERQRSRSKERRRSRSRQRRKRSTSSERSRKSHHKRSRSYDQRREDDEKTSKRSKHSHKHKKRKSDHYNS